MIATIPLVEVRPLAEIGIARVKAIAEEVKLWGPIDAADPPACAGYAAVVGDRAVGFCICHLYPRRVTLARIAVLKDWRHRGAEIALARAARGLLVGRRQTLVAFCLPRDAATAEMLKAAGLVPVRFARPGETDTGEVCVRYELAP